MYWGERAKHFWWMVRSQPWKLQPRKILNKAKREKVPRVLTIACLKLFTGGFKRGSPVCVSCKIASETIRMAWSAFTVVFLLEADVK